MSNIRHGGRVRLHCCWLWVRSLLLSAFILTTDSAGPAGAAIAGRLSRAKTAPKILLLEAGGERAANDNGLLLERFQNIGLYPDQQWGYNTEPVAGFDGRVLPYARGKVLGGSSTINVCPEDIADVRLIRRSSVHGRLVQRTTSSDGQRKSVTKRLTGSIEWQWLREWRLLTTT